MSSTISRQIVQKHPESAWDKPRHTNMFSHERGHGEVHNPVESSDRVKVGSGINRRIETRIQSKKYWHPPSKIQSSDGEVFRKCPHFIDHVRMKMVLLCLSQVHQKASDEVQQGNII